MVGNPYTVQPILKALRLLEGIANKSHDVTLTEIAQEHGLPKTTVFRYLQTMSVAGFLRHNTANDRYGIGPRLSMLADSQTSLHRLRQVAGPLISQLAQEFGGTVNLTVSSGRDIIYVDMVRANRNLPMRAKIGEHHPYHSTAAGKIMLAFLPPEEQTAILEAPLDELTARTIQSTTALRRQLTLARRDGFSLDREETEDSVSCIGVPILDRNKYPIAALSLSVSDACLTGIWRRAAVALEDAAGSISGKLQP